MEVPTEMQGELIDAHGRRLLAIKLTSSSHVLDLGNYADGIYFLRLTDGNGAYCFQTGEGLMWGN
ncbi:MAG: T9SS type A sorting domain-containing protein [Bacteroidetes bacterium]|nr:T9SS type A sorting domain-containing protein [Bacteroidota bacterium]